jgi:CheY-like chemotaxis protein
MVEVATRRGAILVVEDRDDVRQGLAQLLELHGFLVADARTGEQAIEQLTTDPEGVALVLLDLVLPGPLSGIDVRARQLADPALAAIPTIVLTGSDTPQPERLPLQPHAWLDKP